MFAASSSPVVVELLGEIVFEYFAFLYSRRFLSFIVIASCFILRFDKLAPPLKATVLLHFTIIFCYVRSRIYIEGKVYMQINRSKLIISSLKYTE